MLSDQEFY